MEDLADVYESLVQDYLEAYGEFDKKIRALSREQANRTICKALGVNGVDALGRIQAGGSLASGVFKSCVGTEKQSLNIGRFSWEFSLLPNRKFLVTRTARVGWPDGLMSRGHDIQTEVRDGIVMTIVTDQAWHCPLDPEDPCESFDPGAIDDVRCFKDQRTPCHKDGYDSAVHVAEIATNRSVKFGDFEHCPTPHVVVRPTEVIVSAGDCTQTARRPLDSDP